MNKQQLALKIWNTANNLRSKIEANEYKDYILGFIFYKFISDNEVKVLKNDGFNEDDLKSGLNESDIDTVKYCKDKLGYFISYKNLFSTWLKKGKDFNVGDVSDALSAFSRNISQTHEFVFNKIFDTLQGGLHKLGENAGAQTKAINNLIHLIKDIPMDGKQGYDILGFIYEYLISMFAANAGKKAGEFYTPHEVSLLISEIVANFLKDRSEISIYDPTSGSGSLLINIGQSVSKRTGRSDNIKYFAQELKENTYNLTRMNLVMRGINPSNIATRNADTLVDDWPSIEEGKSESSFEPLLVDAVVSNPPYSQNWDQTDRENDPRYSPYGLAPKKKADYAFLLHDLYHIKPDGIMAIVLPHGVLFRGGEEERIRKNLLEKNNIDAIIGLPANIFFGTSIPTIIMVLKKSRPDTNVLIIDASKGFEKVGKNNRLRTSDIKRILDTFIQRNTLSKYSKLVSIEEIRANNYNLNIPRYVDSSEKAEAWDIYASIFGGIPEKEVEELSLYFQSFPTLKNELFSKKSDGYYALNSEDSISIIENNLSLKAYEASFSKAFDTFAEFLSNLLIKDCENLSIGEAEASISNDIFKRIETFNLVDKYAAYQLFSDCWNIISADLEMIQTEGFQTVKKVDPNMVSKKQNNEDVEVQDGYVGHIIPFEILQNKLLHSFKEKIISSQNRLAEITVELEEIIGSLGEEEREALLNDDNSNFVSKKLAEAYKEIIEQVETEEIILLKAYRSISKKKEQQAFIENNAKIDWQKVGLNGSKLPSKKEVDNYIKVLCKDIAFDEGSYEDAISRANALLEEEKSITNALKKDEKELIDITVDRFKNLEDAEAKLLLFEKWVAPLISSLMALPRHIIDMLESKVTNLAKKYSKPLKELEGEIEACEEELADMLSFLTSTEESDIVGLKEFQKILRARNC